MFLPCLYPTPQTFYLKKGLTCGQKEKHKEPCVPFTWTHEELVCALLALTLLLPESSPSPQHPTALPRGHVLRESGKARCGRPPRPPAPCCSIVPGPTLAQCLRVGPLPAWPGTRPRGHPRSQACLVELTLSREPSHSP